MDYPVLECDAEAEAIGLQVMQNGFDFNVFNIDDDKYLLKIFVEEEEILQFICNTYQFVVFSHNAVNF